MIKKILYIVFVLMLFVLMSCGEKNADQPYFDRGLGTGDLRIIPMMTHDGEAVFVDTGTGEELPRLGRWGKASLFYEGWSIVSDSTGKLFFMDKKGKLLNEDRPYHDAIPFRNGVAWVMEDLGYPRAINSKGEVIFELEDAAVVHPFFEGSSMFFIEHEDLEGGFGNSFGVVDIEGRRKQYECEAIDYMFPVFVDGSILFEILGWSLFRNGSDDLVMTMDWDYGDLVCNDERVDNKYRFLNNYVQALRERRMPMRRHGKWGVICLTDSYDDERTLVGFRYGRIVLDGDGYLVKKGNLFGWLDGNGDISINPSFKDARPFGDSDCAAVKDKGNGRWGFIGKDGGWIIEPRFRDVLSFEKRDVAPACDRESKLWGLIDKAGEWVTPPKYKTIHEIGIPDRFLVKDGEGSVGMIDLEGNLVIPPRYDGRRMSAILENNYYGYMEEELMSLVNKHIDFDEIASSVRECIIYLKTSTIEDLINKYALGEHRFPESGGVIDLDEWLIADYTFISFAFNVDDAYDSLDKTRKVNRYDVTVTLIHDAVGYTDLVLRKLMALADSDKDGVLVFDKWRVKVKKITDSKIMMSVETPD